MVSPRSGMDDRLCDVNNYYSKGSVLIKEHRLNVYPEMINKSPYNKPQLPL